MLGKYIEKFWHKTLSITKIYQLTKAEYVHFILSLNQFPSFKTCMFLFLVLSLKNLEQHGLKIATIIASRFKHTQKMAKTI